MKNNADNKKKIFDVNSNVYSNKTLIFHLISKIEENRSMILNNFYSAFSINTTLTIENFDEIFKNRELILTKHKFRGRLDNNRLEMKKELTSLEHVEHKVNWQTEVLKIFNEITDINKKLIGINDKVMKFNSNVVSKNSKEINLNKQMLENAGKDIIKDKNTFNQIKKVIQNKVNKLTKRLKLNDKYIKTLNKKIKNNHKKIDQNKNRILEKRNEILNNKDKIQVNKTKIFFENLL